MDGKKIKEEQIDFIQNIKSLLQPPIIQERRETSAIINELVQRIEKVERMLETEDEAESARKAKVKEQIIFLLAQHKRLTSSQLSRLVGLSRTRCNEYFRELTKEGLTEGVIIDRKKYYKLVNV